MVAVCVVFRILLEGVVRDQAPHFVEELADRDLFAGQLRDPLVLAEDAQGRADGRDEEVGSTDALRPEEVEPLLGDLLEFLANVVPEAWLSCQPVSAD